MTGQPTRSRERRQAIHDLILEELREEHDLDSATVVPHWMVLARLQFFDDVDGPGDVGNIEVISSDPAPTVPDELGLLEFRKAQAYAAIAIEMQAKNAGSEEDSQ